MSPFILGKGQYKKESLDSLLNQGDFRRATRSQCIAYLSMQTIVNALGADWQIVKENAGAVLGTSHGELSATLQFLEDLAQTQTARPLVFQNSLHNAPLGFLAKQFGITGPTLTVSDKYRSGQEAIEAAEILLSENTCKFCFVIGVDLIPEKSADLFLKMYQDGKTPSEGAATLLLSNEEGLSLLKTTKPLGPLPSVLPQGPFLYDSDYVERVVETLNEK